MRNLIIVWFLAIAFCLAMLVETAFHLTVLSCIVAVVSGYFVTWFAEKAEP